MTKASIVVPTRGRAAYLDVTLASVTSQAQAAGAEVIVVDDSGDGPEIRAVAERYGAACLRQPAALGANAARNRGIGEARGELIVLLDDDVRARTGWLAAFLAAADELPDVEIFAGRLIPVYEDARAPRSCGGEAPSFTHLDLGGHDRWTRYAWSANMALRRSTFDRVGAFRAELAGAGEEEEWQDRALAAGSRGVRYVSGAAVEHRRAGEDARLRALAASAYARGRASRRYDRWRGAAPSRTREALTLGGCVGHVARRRCTGGVTQVAHSAGRMREALTGGTFPGSPEPRPSEDFLSGSSGTVGGRDLLRRLLRDGGLDAYELLSGRRGRLARAARTRPDRRSVLVLGLVRRERAALGERLRSELARSRHDVEVVLEAPGPAGKFENLNALLEGHQPERHDWLVVMDDDVVLPRGFLDRFLFLVERYGLALAQPAHRLASHAAWEVTRRHRGSAVRETAFVEIGPVTAFARHTFGALLPFPPLQMGWGLDLHWAAIARQSGWRCGVVDALPIRHRAAPVASAYSREAAIAEARRFLAERPYLKAGEAERTLVSHHSW